MDRVLAGFRHSAPWRNSLSYVQQPTLRFPKSPYYRADFARPVGRYRVTAALVHWMRPAHRGTWCCRTGTRFRWSKRRLRPVLSARTWLTRSPVSSPRKTRPPPAPQQKLRSRARGGSMTAPAVAATVARLVIHVAIAAQIARIVEDDFFLVLSRPLAADPRIAPGIRCDARSAAACRTPSSLPGWCARNAGRWRRSSSPWTAPAFRGWIRRAAGRPDRCPGAAPDRRCISPCAARRSWCPGSFITRANAATISRPLGSYPPMQPSHRQYSCVPSNMGKLLLLDELVALARRRCPAHCCRARAG